MRGHVRKRGGRWAVVVELGPRPAQRCDECGKRFWVERHLGKECPACGGRLGTPRPERRQHWESGFRSRGEAQEALTQLLSRLQAGTFVKPSKVTVFEFATEAWLPHVRANRRATTAELYETLLRAYVLPRLGIVRLQDLSTEDLNGLYRDLLAGGSRTGRPLAPKTVRNVHTLLHRLLADALKWGRVPRNVADAAEAPSVPKSTRAVWNPRQLRTFLEHVRQDRLYALWLTAATTGLRRGEILGLRWDKDVDLDAGRLAVGQTVVLVGGKVTFSRPKTEKSSLPIALDRATVEALRAHRRRQLRERLASDSPYRDHGLVFANEDGSPIHPERLTDRFAALARQAGLPVIRFHDLRHSYATAALMAGVPLKVVSERLRHANVGITGDVYSHVLPEVDQEAAEVVAARILGVEAIP